MILDYVRLSWRGIKARKVRSILTILGIVVGVAAVVALISIAQGLQENVMREFEAIGYDTILATPGTAAQMPGQAPGGFRGPFFGGAQASVLDLSRLTQLPQVAAVGAIRTETAVVTAPGLAGQGLLRIIGLSPRIAQDFPGYFAGFSLARGRQFQEDELAVILGPLVAQDLGVDIGDTITIEGQSFAVVGILRESQRAGMLRGLAGDPNYGIYVPIKAMEKIFGEPNKVTLLLVKAATGTDVAQVAQLVRQVMASQGTPVTTTTVQEMSEMVSRTMGTLQGTLAAIAGISLLVGAIGIVNTMYTAVLERTREIGIMKAVGARRTQILELFLLESGMVGLLGGAVGVAVGAGLATLAGRFVTQAMPMGERGMGSVSFSPVFSPGLVFGALALSFVIGAVAGVWPAQRAARLKPVEALRYE